MEKIKYRLRMITLSAVFVLLTTTVSMIIVLSFNVKAIDPKTIASVWVGALMGQVILLMSMGAMSYINKNKPDLLAEVLDLEDENKKVVDTE